MESKYLGVVTMTSIENVRPSNYAINENTTSNDLMNESRIKLVHYPDCQQLIIWLPTDGVDYNDISIYAQPFGTVIWRKEIREIINGSIQIILDTLPFPSGDMSIKITKNNGLLHIVNLTKYNEGVSHEVPVIVVGTEPVYGKASVIYRDGLGNIIPDQDLIMRAQVMNDMIRKFSRKVVFENMGRSNNVIYKDGEKSLSFWSEFGSGDCLFYISIPAVETWEKQTGFNLADRDEIIRFIATETLHAQTSSSGAYFNIEDSCINFYKGPKKICK